MKPYVVGFIFARGGSKGVPRKNIRLLAGKPLIAYAIETARSSELVNRIIVSTEDAEIAEVAKQYGAEVPFVRPKELAQDDSPDGRRGNMLFRRCTAIAVLDILANRLKWKQLSPGHSKES